MTQSDRFDVPAARLTTEKEVRHSRFIATVDMVRDRGAFEALLAEVRGQWPDANHHCWAYLAGPPGDLRYADKSDDGEPRGTAGRPMLGVLEHSGLGFVGAIVTRYFGGIKLGAGGLVRAYGQSVSDALTQLTTRVEFVTRRLDAQVPYTLLATVDHWLKSTQIRVAERVFEDSVTLALDVPLGDVDETLGKLAALGQGAIRLRSQ